MPASQKLKTKTPRAGLGAGKGFKATSGKKLARPPSQQTSRAWWGTPGVPATWEVIGKWITVHPGGPRHKKEEKKIQAPVTHAYNPSCLEGRDQEDRGSKAAPGRVRENSRKNTHTRKQTNKNRFKKKKKKRPRRGCLRKNLPLAQTWKSS
jgi:hypothetical protein